MMKQLAIGSWAAGEAPSLTNDNWYEVEYCASDYASITSRWTPEQARALIDFRNKVAKDLSEAARKLLEELPRMTFRRDAEAKRELRAAKLSKYQPWALEEIPTKFGEEILTHCLVFDN